MNSDYLGVRVTFSGYYDTRARLCRLFYRDPEDGLQQ